MKWFAKVWAHDAEMYSVLGPHRARLSVLVAVVLLALVYFATVPSPFARRVPVVVRFCDEQIVRASADAFVGQVHVSRGERVEKGRLLVQLSDPELSMRRDEFADDLKLARLREIQFRRQGELALSAAEADRAASLQRQFWELDAAVAGLEVYASRDGLVVGFGIESLEGRYVNQGDELLSVCDPQEKELLVAITSVDIEAYNQAAVKAEPADVRLRGGNSFLATPTPLRPRARQTLPHPAFGANVGGPIAVELSPDGKEELRPASPLMESITRLDPVTSAEIQTGQIGTMTISDNRSLVKRVVESMR